MTLMQNLWLTVFNFGPAIYLGMYKQWWVGIAALVATFALSWLLFFVGMKLPTTVFMLWAWVKPPLIASVIVYAGLLL